jgi:tetratricopeptide (TPR) repeat protein
VLQRRRQVLGDDAPDTLYSLNNLGGLLLSRAQADRSILNQAEPLLRSAFEASARSLKDDDPLKPFVLNNYATALRMQGRLKEAEPIFSQALSLRQRFLSENHPNTLDSLYVSATLLQQLGRNTDAEPLFGELYWRVSVAPIPPARKALYSSGHGPCLVKIGRYADAERPLLEAYRQLDETGQLEHPVSRAVVRALAEVFNHTNRPEEAAKWRAELAKLEAATRPASGPASGPTSAPAVSS